MEMDWNQVFIQSEAVTFDELEDGSIFAIPNSEKINKYWRTSKNNYAPYMSPIIAEKIDENTLQELMTDLPVPLQRVNPEKAKTIKVVPVTFVG